jgi:MYXO-CTERM domain-containing protein
MKSATFLYRSACAAASFLLALAANNAQANITAGDILIYRVGTGSGTLSSVATAVFLDEYTPLGVLVQSIAMPTTGGTALTATGNDGSDGILARSQDGSTIIFTGYRSDVGSASPSSADPATVNRVIGTVGNSGVANTSIGLTDVNGTIRSASGTSGSGAFYASASGGLRYIASPSGSSTSTLIDSRNARQALVRGNNLYNSSTLSGNPAQVLGYGNLPTTLTTGSPIVALGLTTTLNGIALFDLSPSVAGDDTLYAVGNNRIYKYTFNGTAWSANGTLTATGVQNITGAASGSTVSLFLTSGTTLYSETDSSGYGANITGSLTTLAAAGSNKAFRGLTLIPEPSSVTLGLLAVGTLLALRRRRS